MQSILQAHQSINKLLYLLALFAGGLSALAFAPFNIAPLAWITPAILFYTLSKANNKKQHFYLGWLFGIGLFGVGASWPFYSIYFFAHAPLAAAIIGVSLFVIIVALLTLGLFGLLAAQFRQCTLFSRLLLFYPASWVFFEWFRAWFLTGFPWLYLGNSQIDSVIAAYAPITGVLGVSFVCVLISGALLSFILGNSIERTVFVKQDPNTAFISRSAKVEERFGYKIRIISAFIIVGITVLAFTLKKIDWTQKTGKPLTVSVLQSNISQKQKLNQGNLDAMISLYLDMTKKSHKSDLIVWPETALFATFNHYMDSIILPLQKSLKKNKAVLIGGFFINKNNGIENSVLAISKDNREIYSKRHLVPFGEYIPLLGYIRWMGDWIPHSNIDAGKNKGTLQVLNQKAQMTICYEDAFGSEIIQSLPESTLLINVTHDGWFTGSFEPAQHMQIARMRSLETGRYMVRATTTGPAGIINEKGIVLATAPQYTKKIITHKVQPYKGATPYVRWGNWLIMSIMFFIILLGMFINRKNNNYGNT